MRSLAAKAQCGAPKGIIVDSPSLYDRDTDAAVDDGRADAVGAALGEEANVSVEEDSGGEDGEGNIGESTPEDVGDDEDPIHHRRPVETTPAVG